MSEPKHTPGRWAILGENLDGEIEVVAPNRETVCVVLADEGRAEADARLIAAAPDLYEALKGMLGLVALVKSRDDLPPGLLEALQNSHRVQAASAALAKAEGRQ